MTDTIFKILGYETSRDYERLADLMQRQSVICIVDYGKDCRDVAHTLWSPSRDGNGVWQLSARGIGYVYAFSRAEFINQCVRANVDVLMPNDKPTNGAA
jgi:hypothetical protein